MLVLVASILLEMAMFNKFLWTYRLNFIVTLTVLIPAASVLSVVSSPSWLSGLLVLLSIARLANLFRVAKARMHEAYLLQTTRRTSLIVALAQLLVICIIASGLPIKVSNSDVSIWLALLQIFVATGILSITIRNIYKTKYRQGEEFYADKDLPTVSLLIPARNETRDLEECLRSALASEYPKLEIIVLDDCSHLKTSDVIKSFAHDGVRFIKGSEPTGNWLAKNQAYQALSTQATGELLLFCGVDVRFGPQAIKALVTELLTRDKTMISILPHRLSGNMAGAFIQPMRYWWELSLPRVLFNRPAVLSSCWLISRKKLIKLGGFKSVSHSIIPEAVLARELIKSNNYSFIRANDVLDIQTRKSYSDQRATTIRTRYPQLRRRPENVIALLLAELCVLLGPFIGVTVGLFIDDSSLTLLSSIAAVLLCCNHVLIVHVTSPAHTLIALFNLPIEILNEMYLTVTSMLRYEFGTVEWKDRNVCIPVMHVTPRLPKV